MTNCDFFRRVVAVSILAIGAPAFGQADLAVTKTVSNAVPVEGEEIVYTVTVTNDGPSDASGVTVADQLPAGVTFVGVDSIDQGSYDEIAGAWDVGDLGESASVQLAVRASVDAGTAETTGTGDFIDVFTSGDVNTIARGVTFGPDGDLYVTNGNVRRFDGTTGAFIGVFADDPMLGFSVGLTFGPDGNLYVADITNDHIVRFDGASGAFIDVFASGGLDDPDGIVFGPDGHLYVSSFFNDRVIRYDGATGALIDVFATGGGLDGPQGLTFGADGNLYVSSLLNGQVIRYDGSTGAPIDVFVTGGSSPHGLRFGPDGHLYVSSFINDVVRYDGTTGAFIDTFASDAALTMVQGLTFGPDGNLYVVSDGTDEVVRFQGFITNIADVAATSADPDLLDNSDFAGITVLAPTPFEPPVEEPAEGAPLIHAVGDLDTSLTSMGTVDVAVVIPDADPGVNGEVQIFLNLGNGMGGLWLGLDPQLPTIPVGPDPTGIALGDLTGDDYLDFAVTNAGNDTVSFFVNNADDTGTFTAGPVVGGTFDMPSAIVTGEFGAGAGLDFAVANEGSSEVDIIGNPLTPIATVTVGLNP
ncbi:MAG: DUF11 domain-containing protein, partial [Planctomycetes bacterium]|nr:DUF11 domain-containing protein [Planctomycetota bacterium]